MNTVMDDNKMLTLASNERIPLTPSMRLLLEINHMNHCSPATVSRGGVIFVNAEDVGWKPVRLFQSAPIPLLATIVNVCELKTFMVAYGLSSLPAALHPKAHDSSTAQ